MLIGPCSPQIMASHHNMLQRQALILRAGEEPLTDEDRQRLKVGNIVILH